MGEQITQRNFGEEIGRWDRGFPIVTEGYQGEPLALKETGLMDDIDGNGYKLVNVSLNPPLTIKLLESLFWEGTGIRTIRGAPGGGDPTEPWILRLLIDETNGSSTSISDPASVLVLEAKNSSGGNNVNGGPGIDFVNTTNADGTTHIGHIGIIGDVASDSGRFVIGVYDSNLSTFTDEAFRVIREGFVICGPSSSFSRSFNIVVEADAATGAAYLQVMGNQYFPFGDNMIEFNFRGGFNGDPAVINNATVGDFGVCAGGGDIVFGADPFTYTNKAKIDFRRGVSYTEDTKTADYSIGDNDNIIFADSTSNDVAITLPDPSGKEGRTIVIQRINGNSGFDVTVDTAAGNINNGSSINLPRRWDTAVCRTDGSNWFSAGTVSNATAIETITANTTLDGSHQTVLVDASSSAVTVTLPAAADNEGVVYSIKSIDSTNTITIDPNALETIDGNTTLTIPIQWDCYVIQSNGTNWFITN